MTPQPSPQPVESRSGPLFLLLANIVCVATAELFLSMGAKAVGTGGEAVGGSILNFAALGSGYTVVGIAFHISAFVCWMLALRTVPLGLAYNFTAVNQVVVPVAALVLLHERVTPVKWIGIALVVAGFVLLVPLIVRTEEQLEPAGEQRAEPEEVAAG